MVSKIRMPIETARGNPATTGPPWLRGPGGRPLRRGALADPARFGFLFTEALALREEVWRELERRGLS